MVAYRDLREFLDVLDKTGQLCRLQTEVDPEYEVGAVCDRVFREYGQDRNPALLFEHPKGSAIPIAVNVLSTRHRVAQAIGCDLREFNREWLRRTASPIAPVIVRDGPCKENIKVGEKVNLYELPVPTWNEKDGGQFLTYACHISKDPETGARNMGMYRNQVFNRNTLGLCSFPFKHIQIQLRKAHARKQSFPVALAVGLDPVIPIAAVTPAPFGADELALAGALGGKPVELVPCETVPLEVPATAEWVIEGEVRPGKQRDEGPFGEALGYYGEVQPHETIHVTAITHRHHPIYQAAHMRRPPNEQTAIIAGTDAEVFRQCPLPGLSDFHLLDGGCRLVGVAAIKKSYEAHAKTLAMGILGSTAGQRIKIMIVVDDDVDIRNVHDVLWTISTRCNLDQNLQVLKNLLGSPLDPSMPEASRASGANLVSKMIVDATRPLVGKFPEVVRPNPEATRRVNSRWQSYRIHEAGKDKSNV